jgi:diaminopimelate decarboxylase
MEWMEIRDNTLCIGGLEAAALVKEFGSPLYVYDAELIAARTKALQKAFSYPHTKLHFACKANSTREILQLIRELGVGLETVSIGEVQKGVAAGFSSRDMLYTCSNASRGEIEAVLKAGVRINADSLNQVRLIGELQPGAQLGLRLNLGVGAGAHEKIVTGGAASKFGIVREQLTEVQELCDQHNLRVVGLHQHIGSNILDGDTIISGFEDLLSVARSFPRLEYLDGGGGFGVPQKYSDRPLNIGELGSRISQLMQQFVNENEQSVELYFEPGTYLVSEAGMLLSTVMDIKESGTRTFVGLDSGFNHFPGPAFYGFHHEIVNTQAIEGARRKVDVVGNVCEAGDVFARDYEMVVGDVGEVFAILNAGAYGYEMGMTYNSRPLPRQILVSQGVARLLEIRD